MISDTESETQETPVKKRDQKYENSFGFTSPENIFDPNQPDEILVQNISKFLSEQNNSLIKLTKKQLP